ncbi:MAG: hypothetical protein KGY81_02200, partial [Phycisphaerae bacterium]|nr:hypothetical protein [Phycisphaerae bacterium]
FQPGQFVPAVNDLAGEVTPGDAAVFAGEPLTVRLQLARGASLGARAEVLIAGEAQPRPMFVDESGRMHTLAIEAVHRPLRYAVRLDGDDGRSRWPIDRPWFGVTLREATVEQFEVAYRYPPYTGLERRTVTLSPDGATVKAPMGSKAELRMRFAESVPAGVIEFGDGERCELRRSADGRRFSAEWEMLGDRTYKLRFVDDGGRTIKQLPNGDGGGQGSYAIRAIVDAPPTVQISQPGRNVTWPPGQPLPLVIRASDAYGLGGLTLMLARDGQQPQAVEGFSPDVAGRTDVTVAHELQLSDAKAGDEFVYLASATDRRNLPGVGGPQAASTATYTVSIRSAARVSADASKRFDRLQRRLLEILRWQASEWVNTQRLQTRAATIDRVHAGGKDLLAGQKDIRNAVATLAREFPFDGETDDIRKALALLASNEAALAVQQAEVLATLGAMKDRLGACELLGATQDAIINVLREMLAIMPSLARKAGDVEQPGGSDLTADQRRAKREALVETLQEFTAEQRKVIAASNRLNKTALDDFTSADEKLLKELTAVQDKWEKFLNEAYTDFSKLAEQDFSNPSMLKELISVKTDVTMARDALKKKAVTIATAAEQSGVENAESLTANIEKWLPDEPDRRKWEMEALPEQQNTEQAELFSELEDLVGDLLEEEEDLFEEMDDLASKATMSGDKGIGWDAKDGPISNMNAQGVTGNQLPNTSEISGRSGEGRTGKSAGEFVEDKAVGKGGRRTPTRMSNDPYQAGEVNDVSAEPPGGATGGGKLSGSGEEGLEGAAPAQRPGAMQRLAGKQASVVNRAERIAANFKQGDYAGFRLREAIRLMNRVRHDLETGNYRNALRRRNETLQAIRQARMMVGDDIEIRQDTTEALPKYVRDDIADAMKGKMPEAYRHVLEQYYRRLSEQP